MSAYSRESNFTHLRHQKYYKVGYKTRNEVKFSGISIEGAALGNWLRTRLRTSGFDRVDVGESADIEPVPLTCFALLMPFLLFFAFCFL